MVELTAYKCSHCGRLYQRRHACAQHEWHCWRNDRRVPKVGEVFDSRAWYWPECLSGEGPSWTPHTADGFGYIWDGAEWQPVQLDGKVWPYPEEPPLDTPWSERPSEGYMIECERLDRWPKPYRLGLLGLEQKTPGEDATDAQE